MAGGPRGGRLGTGNFNGKFCDMIKIKVKLNGKEDFYEREIIDRSGASGRFGVFTGGGQDAGACIGSGGVEGDPSPQPGGFEVLPPGAGG